jgi:glucose-6-phosphate 1-epimerase
VATGVTLSLEITLGAQLHLSLVTTNGSAMPFTFSQALHTYLNVGDIREVVVSGLNESEYDDTLLPDGARAQWAPTDTLIIDCEIDRIYYPKQPLCLSSPTQSVVMKTEGSGSAVIWNPWLEKSMRLSHFLPEDYLRTLCIETANCGRDERTLAPGASHALKVSFLSQATGKS